MRHIPTAGVVFLLYAFAAGCSSETSETRSAVYSMGEQVQVGPLIYTILDAEWHDQLGDPPNVRTPQHRFLAVRLSVTNSGAASSGIPALRLVDAQGTAYEELNDGEGLSEWLGFLRNVKAAQTERGRVLFDAPTGAYRLRLVNDADPDNEKVALVDIPLQLGTSLPQPAALPAPAQP